MSDTFFKISSANSNFILLWCEKAVKLDFFDSLVVISVQRRHGERYKWTSVHIFVRKTVLKVLRNVKIDTKSLPWLQKVNGETKVKFLRYFCGHGYGHGREHGRRQAT